MDVKANTNRLLMHSLSVKNSSCSQTRYTTAYNFLQHIGLIEAIEALFIILLTFGIIVANILLILIINNRRYAAYIHQQPRYLLTSLALNDLSIGLLITPFGLLPALLHCWPYGEIFCQIQALLRGALSQQSAVILVCMAVDRYICALYPRRYYQHTSKKGCVAILSITWISSLVVFGVMVLPKGYYFNSTGLMACEPFYNKPSYRILVTCALYFPTTMVLMYCYGSSFHISQHRILTDAVKVPLTTVPTQHQQQHIHHHLHHHHHLHPSDNEAVHHGTAAATPIPSLATPVSATKAALPTPTNLLPNNPVVNLTMALGTNQLPTQSTTTQKLPPIAIKTSNKSTSHSMAAISLGFIVMVTPWTIQEIVTACTGSKLPRFLDFLVTWMALSNSLWNPTVYWLLNVDFRQLTKELLTFRCSLVRTSDSSCCHQHYADFEISPMPQLTPPPPSMLPTSSSSSQSQANFGHYHEYYLNDRPPKRGSILSMCAQHSYTNSLSRSASMNLPPLSNSYCSPSFDDYNTNKLDVEGISEKYWGEILERTVSSSSLLQPSKQTAFLGDSCLQALQLQTTTSFDHLSPDYERLSSRSRDCWNQFIHSQENEFNNFYGPQFCQHEEHCAKNQTKRKPFPNDK